LKPDDWHDEGGRLAARSLADGDPTGWFDRLYAAGDSGRVGMPWSRIEPDPLLVGWAQARDLAGEGRRAIVVGSGLGADAEYIASLGFETVAFDISETAIRIARERFPGSAVAYETADLLDPPEQWLRAFDLVVEIITVQALPDPPRRQAIVNVGRLVAPRGTLLVVAAIHDEQAADGAGPPWPLTRDEIEAFGTDGLRITEVEMVSPTGGSTDLRWRAQLERP
jgi:SAM-dependent methyltransferase